MKHNKFFSVLATVGMLVVSVGLASLAFWETHHFLERTHLKKLTAAHARTVRLDLLEEVQACVSAHVRLAKLLEGNVPRRNWESMAEMLMKDYPGVIAEQWVEPGFRARWTVAKTPDDSDQNLLRAPDAALTSVLKQAEDLGENDVLFTPAFTRENAKSVRRVLVRVSREGKSIGFVVASVDMKKLLDDMLVDQAGAGFGIIVADENGEVYTTGKGIENQGDWTTSAEVKLSGLTLQVRVWPEASLLTGNSATLVEISLAAGALIGSLVFVALDLARASFTQSRELRCARDELELRVHERTKDLAFTNKALGAEISEHKRARQALLELSAQLLRVRDDEQRRIARELHDGTVQTLCALAINLERFQSFIASGGSSQAQELLAQSSALNEQAITEVRTISYLLHPPILEELGLEAALPWYAAGFTARSGIQVNVKVQSGLGRLSDEVELALYRIVQEGLTNIHRHSGSLTADISVVRDANRVELQITDQGCGMPSNALEAGGNPAAIGVGIAGMRERVRNLDGEIEIQSGINGTSIRVELPIQVKCVSEQRQNFRDPDAVPARSESRSTNDGGQQAECA